MLVGVIIPMYIFVTLLIPAFILIKLRSRRSLRKTIRVAPIYGMLSEEYMDKYFFVEIFKSYYSTGLIFLNYSLLG
jgi:hypothetical protein